MKHEETAERILSCFSVDSSIAEIRADLIKLVAAALKTAQAYGACEGFMDACGTAKIDLKQPPQDTI